MKSVSPILATIFCAFCVGRAAAADVTNGPEALICDTGPVIKSFGHAQWLLFGCADGQSLAVVAAPDNKARPFRFLFLHQSDGYDLSGNGTGDRKTSDAAYADLSRLSGDDIRNFIALAQEARRATKTGR